MRDPGQPSSFQLRPSTRPGEALSPIALLGWNWANAIKRLQFTVARQRNRLKSELLRRLDTLPAKHELVLRSTSPATPEQFWARINTHIANVEAVLMHVVGVAPQDECLHCQEGRGPRSSNVSLSLASRLSVRIATGIIMLHGALSPGQECPPLRLE